MIGLCMIVKDESEVIGRCLRSCFPYVDTYCIVDTGSKDNTIEIIKTISGEFNIKGYIYEKPWVNFGYNRTECLKLAKDNNIQWMLMIDADDSLDVSDKDFKFNLNNDETGYYINIETFSLSFVRVQLFNSKYNWKYVGALHEYPLCTNFPANSYKTISDKIKIIARTEGARSKDPQKYLKDALLLEKEYISLKNSKNLHMDIDENRTLFYLAQSYRDAKEYNRAIKYYKLRIKKGGWNEEQYVSYCNLINLVEDIDEKIKFCWEAQNLIPNRKDAVYKILLYCRQNNIFTQQIFALGMAYKHIKFNLSKNHLFVDTSAYGWSYEDELSIIAYYTNHYDICYNLCKEILNISPDNHRDRIKINLKLSQIKM